MRSDYYKPGLVNVIFLVLIYFSITAMSFSAQITGTIYDWYTLEPKDNVIVTINTTPEQKYISKDGKYEFNVPEGTYILEAKSYDKGRINFMSSENLTITGNGNYIIDLILFPVLNESDSLENVYGNETLRNTFILGENDNSYNENSTLTKKSLYLYIVFTALLLLIPVCYIFCYNSWKRDQEHNFDEETQKVMDILKKEKRIRQNELRRKLMFSDSKLSLILIELEHRGIIKKIKKGRGNIIYFQK